MDVEGREKLAAGAYARHGVGGVIELYVDTVIDDEVRVGQERSIEATLAVISWAAWNLVGSEDRLAFAGGVRAANVFLRSERVKLLTADEVARRKA